MKLIAYIFLIKLNEKHTSFETSAEYIIAMFM